MAEGKEITPIPPISLLTIPMSNHVAIAIVTLFILAAVLSGCTLHINGKTYGDPEEDTTTLPPPPPGKNVTATAGHRGTTGYVQYLGGPDDDKVDSIVIHRPIFSTVVIPDPPAGFRYDFEYNPGKDHVVVTAHFKDGTELTILDTYV